ncbi:hypothetical protein [Acidomonas methanolica]|uniref:Sulfotransferase n=2 Tax=Acidomonas methanolica TaxID=437 RepID=A0A023D5Z9_ACIMT|nr:hypothetical protein [Acidomonas methanolica]MBU2654335.1 hypothetical protein [Acidomonas methanolica]TCS28422.1 hypothetical protein EDC31_10810 [Acidomonas methanolica]GAJ29206.1 hypothetical protein Amme_054_008 [Acidomonas methanolica NBRC 104435]GEK99562.1 hypothetical protein AME01nite_20610 [Acidomonas methanolica NBRC 104435]
MERLSALSDPAWRAAWEAVRPLVGPHDTVLLPAGSWPDDLIAARREYQDRIEIGDASAVLLHKGRLCTLSRPELSRLLTEWQIVHANEVFICFCRDTPPSLKNRLRRYGKHVKPAWHHLAPRVRRRSAATLYFMHIPKTAGTSAWEAISRDVEAKLYYDGALPFLAHPPVQGDYDLIGGHIPLSVLERHAGPDALIAAVLRDPVMRFRSAFLHARRAGEDPATFSATMRRMREMPLSAFLDHPDARLETNLQIFMLGTPPDGEGHPSEFSDFVARAHAALDRPNRLFLPDVRLGAFIAAARKHLGLPRRGAPSARRNVSDLVRQSRDLEEFAACIDRVRALAAPETALYRRLAPSGRSG